MAQQNKVAANIQQDFTAVQQSQARKNISATNMRFRTGSTAYGPVYSNADSVSVSDTTHSMYVDFGDGNMVQYEGLVPIAVSGDNGKVLTVTDDLGSYEWQNRGPAIFAAVYDQTTYQEIVDAAEAGKLVILVGSDGHFVGNYKYHTEHIVLFDRFYAQPQRGTEFIVTDEDIWSSNTIYPTDLSLTQVYTRDRVGTNALQSTIGSWIADSYTFTVPWFNMQGTEINEPLWTKFLTDRPEVIRYDYSSDMAVEFTTDPGSGIITLEFQLEWCYRPTGSAEYNTIVCNWAPKQVIVLRNFAQPVGSTHYLSDFTHIEYSLTFDRNRFQNFITNRGNYIDCFFRLGAKLGNISYTDYSWLEQKAAHAQYTFWRH